MYQMRLKDGTITHSSRSRDEVVNVARALSQEVGIDIVTVVARPFNEADGDTRYWTWNTDVIPRTLQRKYGLLPTHDWGKSIALYIYAIVLGVLLSGLIIDTIRMAGG
jgi:hypothetical protein